MRFTERQIKALGIQSNPSRKAQSIKNARKDALQGRDRLFDELCKAHGLETPVHEYRFHKTRQWRFDYLFCGWLALEVEGGAYTNGRHTRGQGFENDIEKYNEAVMAGFVVVRCLPADIESGAAFALIKRALGSLGDQG